MKRLISLRLATVILGTALSASVAFAQPSPHPPGPPGPPPGPGYMHPPGPPPQSGPGWHQWHEGDHYHGNRYVVDNWQHYRLRPPPPGYQWVQDSGQSC